MYCGPVYLRNSVYVLYYICIYVYVCVVLNDVTRTKRFRSTNKTTRLYTICIIQWKRVKMLLSSIKVVSYLLLRDKNEFISNIKNYNNIFRDVEV